MAAPSAQSLQRLADETGHRAGTLEKALRLLDLLQEIARDRVLSDRLVLKGGTALNLFHIGLDRLSVDIDLNGDPSGREGKDQEAAPVRGLGRGDDRPPAGHPPQHGQPGAFDRTTETVVPLSLWCGDRAGHSVTATPRGPVGGNWNDRLENHRPLAYMCGDGIRMGRGQEQCLF